MVHNIHRVIGGVVLAAVLVVGCSSHGSPPLTIQNVVGQLHCAGYHRHEEVAPMSKDSGYCTLPNGREADLYLMASHQAAAPLIELSKEYGATDKDIKWYGNILVVTS